MRSESAVIPAATAQRNAMEVGRHANCARTAIPIAAAMGRSLQSSGASSSLPAVGHARATKLKMDLKITQPWQTLDRAGGSKHHERLRPSDDFANVPANFRQNQRAAPACIHPRFYTCTELRNTISTGNKYGCAYPRRTKSPSLQADANRLPRHRESSPAVQNATFVLPSEYLPPQATQCLL